MKDIAKDLGVSVVTVSKVLHNHSDIGAETRRRVLRRMKELNYRPNLAARALVTGRMCLIGLIVPDLTHPFFATVAKGLSSVLRSHGYSLILSFSEDDPALERKEVEQMLARRVDAVILASVRADADSFTTIESQQTPCVLLDRRFAHVAANFVGIDDQAAASLATEHLIDIGCRTIAHIGGSIVSTAVDRQAGYSATLAKHGIRMPTEYTVSYPRGDDGAERRGYDGMKQLLKLKPRPDGVFCYNDPVALGAMKAILEGGLRIPDDVALVGCGNANYAELLRVPLSSVDQESATLGRNAAKLTLSLLKRKEAGAPQTLLVEPKLIVRESSRRRAVRSSPARPI
ncbi:Ribose operon repressor [Acidisarcina polymorpha]|uniref:Ribose operon repressor n=1 Tax=Acidisarcina polymorpha TaxID=2211140 RepID=A0A2Z5G2C7_9BACT|nr:LacI family DNA-binding transcriptional regulator [Acidisarcina polymorpha]AXC13252.1 Ribose operon repressor [Acidisarcina polymorpha]